MKKDTLNISNGIKNLKITLNLYNKDKWLTEQFGYDVYNIKNLNINILKKIDNKSSKNFCYFKTNNKVNIKYNKKIKFKLIEKSITFKLKIINKYTFCENCRLVQKKDKNFIIKLSKKSFTNSRFFQDDNISKNLAKKIKENWINNYFLGKRGNQIIVYEENNKIYGFILLIENKKTLIIDLIAVDKRKRGKNIGTKLLESSINFFRNSKFIIAGTQENNIKAIKFYKKNNFFIFQKGYTFHRHKL